MIGQGMAALVAHRYAPLKRLARGSIGTVHLARDEVDGRMVALKRLHEHLAADPGGVRRFEREINHLAGVDHPALVEVYDAGRDEVTGTPFIVMEWLQGATLDELMARRPLTLPEALVVIDEVLGALGAAHTAGVVHRDIKPDNIFVARTPDGGLRVKLLDFGLARLVEAPSSTQSGATLGTPHFMSPEQAVDPREVTPAADVWSVGVLLYLMLTGQRPFDGPTVTAVLLKVQNERPPPVEFWMEEVDPRLSGLIEACLAPDPADRPTDANAVQALLAEAIDRTRPASPAQLREELAGVVTVLPEWITASAIMAALAEPPESDPAASGPGSPQSLPPAIVAAPIGPPPDSLNTAPAPLEAPPRRRGLWIVAAVLLIGGTAYVVMQGIGQDPARAPQSGASQSAETLSVASADGSGAARPESPEPEAAEVAETNAAAPVQETPDAQPPEVRVVKAPVEVEPAPIAAESAGAAPEAGAPEAAGAVEPDKPVAKKARTRRRPRRARSVPPTVGALKPTVAGHAAHAVEQQKPPVLEADEPHEAPAPEAAPEAAELEAVAAPEAPAPEPADKKAPEETATVEEAPGAAPDAAPPPARPIEAPAPPRVEPLDEPKPEKADPQPFVTF